MDDARFSLGSDTPETADNKLGAVTFAVFCVCLIAIMVMGTIKLGMVLFS